LNRFFHTVQYMLYIKIQPEDERKTRILYWRVGKIT